MLLGIFLETTCWAIEQNSGKGRNTAALVFLYRRPVGPFRHIGAIRVGSVKLQKWSKGFFRFLHSTDAENTTLHEKCSCSEYNF